MIDEIIVLDDIITPTYQDYLENSLLIDQAVSWVLLNDVSYDNERANFGSKTNKPGLLHPLKVDGQIKSHLYNLVLPIVFNSVDKIGFKLHDIFQGRCFLQLPSNTGTNNPHIDLGFPHLVCLYYVNDSDGDTVVYEQTSDKVDEINVKNTTFTEKQRVSPKKGRVLLFNGKYYHSSSSPAMTQRCIINFNLI